MDFVPAVDDVHRETGRKLTVYLQSLSIVSKLLPPLTNLRVARGTATSTASLAIVGD